MLGTQQILSNFSLSCPIGGFGALILTLVVAGSCAITCCGSCAPEPQ